MNWGAEEWSAFFAACAVAFALWEYNGSNRTRAKDLRWRQAERADDMLNLILENPKVVNAFHLLDWNGGKRFTYTNGDQTGTFTATCEEQNTDLEGKAFSLREMFVRESFDALYEAFERLEHAIDIKVIAFDDIAQPFDFYVKKIRQRGSFVIFERNQGYDMAQHFLSRYDAPPSPRLFSVGWMKNVVCRLCPRQESFARRLIVVENKPSNRDGPITPPVLTPGASTSSPTSGPP